MSQNQILVSRPVAQFDGQGYVGDSWISQAMVDLLEDVTTPERLQRARRYAASGNIKSMQIDPGRVRAVVMGERAYQVLIVWPILAYRDWEMVAEHLAASEPLIRSLMDGTVPSGSRSLFRDCTHSLIPRTLSEVGFRCSCPDNHPPRPCKHVAAVVYGLAVSMQKDNDVAFVLRGQRIIDSLKQASRVLKGDTLRLEKETREAEQKTNQDVLVRFWGGAVHLPPTLPPLPTAKPGKLLRRHGIIPGTDKKTMDALNKAYEKLVVVPTPAEQVQRIPDNGLEGFEFEDIE